MTAARRSLRVLRPDGAELAVEVVGDAGRPVVLLNAGTSCPMDWWRVEFCEGIAAHGLRVVRYDLRDTGESTRDPVGEPRYGLPDLVEDAVAILDELGVADAHWVGFSMGGWISQLAALDHPDRVRSLTLISTRATGHGAADADLPEVSDRLMASFDDPAPEPDWSDPGAVIDYLSDGDRDFAGAEFDAEHSRAVWGAAVARTLDFGATLVNHAAADQGPRWRERLADVLVPTAVVHGAEDPLFPVGNGEALAREIPAAEFILLPGVGHELPPPAWPVVTEAIVAMAAPGA